MKLRPRPLSLWFDALSAAARARGEADPLPLHTAGLVKLGVVGPAQFV